MPAIARAARRAGAVILEGTAVRTLDREGGRVTGVVSERGRLGCKAVVLAGGAWSRVFLQNIGLSLPQLAVRASAQRTSAAPWISESALGAPDVAIRRRQDGGYTVARSGAAGFDIIPAAFQHFGAFFPVLKSRWRILKLRFGKPFFDALGQRHWDADQMSPFEVTRVLDPAPDTALLDDVMRSAKTRFPQLADAQPIERWGGAIDVTPDEIPLLGPIDAIPGLFLATGFSGHGFGIGQVRAMRWRNWSGGARPPLTSRDCSTPGSVRGAGSSRPRIGLKRFDRRRMRSLGSVTPGSKVC